MIYFKSFILAILSVLILSSCASTRQTIYNWDSNYIDSVYNMLNDKSNVSEEIKNIERYVNDTNQKNIKVAPGVYAHLGLLYSKLGNKGKAMSYLDKESKAFPKVSKYIDILKNKGAK